MSLRQENEQHYYKGEVTKTPEEMLNEEMARKVENRRLRQLFGVHKQLGHSRINLDYDRNYSCGSVDLRNYNVRIRAGAGVKNDT